MSARKMMGMLMLVALSISTGLAQDGRSERDDRKVIRIDPLNQDGRFFVSSYNYDDDFSYFRNIGRDIRSSVRGIGRNVRNNVRGIRHDVRNNVRIKTRNRRSFNSWMIDRHYPRRGTSNLVNVYLGLNNFLEDGELPNSDAIYNLHPISSWYLGVNFDNITRIYGPLYLEWGAGLSMQDFSFENTRIRVETNDTGVLFNELADIRGRKSKLSVSYVNVHFVPTLSFGRYGDFRVGFGVYGSYKIDSFTKHKYDDVDGNKQKDKVRENLFVNQFKYGFRALVGWDFFDLFFNYDVTELFEEDAVAPRLNPVTFGIIL